MGLSADYNTGTIQTRSLGPYTSCRYLTLPMIMICHHRLYLPFITCSHVWARELLDFAAFAISTLIPTHHRTVRMRIIVTRNTRASKSSAFFCVQQYNRTHSETDLAYRSLAFASFHMLLPLSLSQRLFDNLHGVLLCSRFFHVGPLPYRPPLGVLSVLRKTFLLDLGISSLRGALHVLGFF